MGVSLDDLYTFASVAEEIPFAKGKEGCPYSLDIITAVVMCVESILVSIRCYNPIEILSSLLLNRYRVYTNKTYCSDFIAFVCII